MASYQFITPTKVKLYAEFGYRADGSRARKTKTVTIKTPNSDRAAQRALDAFIAKVSASASSVGSMRLDTFIRGMWWESHVSKLHLLTQREYKWRSERIINGLGSMKLLKIKPYHIEKFFIAEEQAKRSSLRGLYVVLSSIFSCAKKWDLIKENPVKGVERPKVTPRMRPRKFYTVDQMKEVLRVLDENRNITYRTRVEIKLALLAGLREAEIVGILKGKIDYDQHSILIDRQLQWDRKHRCFKLLPIKTELVRTVFFPDKFTEELKFYVDRHDKMMDKLGNARYRFIDPNVSDKPLDLIFTSPIGRPVHPGSISMTWLDFQRKNGLPPLNFHGLRHSCLSMLLNSGAPVKAVQNQAGHRNAKVTLNTYGHGELANQAQSINILNKILP